MKFNPYGMNKMWGQLRDRATLVRRRATARLTSTQHQSTSTLSSSMIANTGCPQRWSRALTALHVVAPFTEENSMEVHNDTGVAFARMWESIDQAKHSVEWITYICKDDHVGQTTMKKLEAAAERGVKVTFLYDDAGNISGRSSLVESLGKHRNGKVLLFNPVLPRLLRYHLSGLQWRLSPGIRNHRKILIVDNSIAYVGGLNIGNEYAGTQVGGSGKFRDSLCIVKGPVVKELALVVEETMTAMSGGRMKRARARGSRVKRTLQRWVASRLERMRDLAIQHRGGKLKTTATPSSSPLTPPPPKGVMCQVLTSNALTRTYEIQRAYYIALARAQHRIWITTPYLMPTRRLFKVLLAAARRGVEVRVLTGSVNTTDPWFMWWASQYIVHLLLQNKVELYEFDGGSVMHAKTVVVDGLWGAVGSYNWDALSNKLLEVTVACADYDTSKELEQQFMFDMARSKRVEEDTFLQRSLWTKFVCWFIYRVGRAIEALTFWSFSHEEVETKLD